MMARQAGISFTFSMGIAAMLLLVTACRQEPVEPLPSDLMPAHLAAVPIPADNPLTPAKVDLGRRLFYDKRLSSQGTVSCASCHRQDLSFSDAPNQVSRGVNNALGQRNAPSLINVAYRPHYFWDGRAATLEDQAMAAFLSSVEMDADTMAVSALLRSGVYRDAWRAAFSDTAVSMRRAMMAIASFERTIVSANSRYDQYVLGNKAALSEQERRGMNLFFSSRSMCGACHGGQDFTNDQFQNIGLFNHYFDRGRYNVTKNMADDGLFKTPSLRNVALTPPYMASGDSDKGPLTTLEQVVEHYNDGGTPFSNKDRRVKKLGLSKAEVADLVAFMKALTDSSVLTRREWSAP
ncbi:MAG: methylamine utilization protein [Candidatus Kapabacteria bacterium]|nr:methylamine utilization protein [Candidatus Kapabacteria bacterium]